MKTTTPSSLSGRVLLSLVLGVIAGSSVGSDFTSTYIIRQGYGQLAMLLATEPLDDVAASGRLDVEQQRKLDLLVAAREFARNELGLNVGDSYALYHDTGGDFVAWNVSAAQVDLLSPKRWTFPIIGTIEYTGFFSRADAEAQLQQLADEGWDAVMYGVDAYSTLGYFPDPVQSRFLERSDGRIVETVIHELAHNTVYAAGQSTYNESLATFIGREGARLFFERRGAGADAILADLEAFYADQVQTTEWLLDLHDALVAHYAQDIPREEKIAGREAVFQAARDRFVAEVLPTLNQPERYAWYAEFPTNNAYVLLYRRYNLDLDVFQQVYEQSDDFRAFVAALQQAGRSPAPFAALREMADAE